MIRKVVCALAVLGLMTGVLFAEEIKGKFKSLDKGSLILTIKGKEETFKFKAKDTKVYNGDEEVKGKEVRTFFKGLDSNADVVLTVEKDGDNVTVKEIKVKK